MSDEKSLWFYGKVYKVLFDPPNKEGREVITNLVPSNASVLDVGCGTGELAIILKERKQCRVVGVDLSQKMIDFARNRNTDNNVVFQQGDATNLLQFNDDKFDYAITSKMIHEVPPDTGQKIINELCRLGQKVIIYDYNVPLPRNIAGLMARVTEYTFGRNHLENFKSYLENDGVIGLIRQTGLEARINQRMIIESNREQIVVLEP